MNKLTQEEIEESLWEASLDDLWHRNEERLKAERQQRLYDLQKRYQSQTD